MIRLRIVNTLIILCLLFTIQTNQTKAETKTNDTLPLPVKYHLSCEPEYNKNNLLTVKHCDSITALIIGKGWIAVNGVPYKVETYYNLNRYVWTVGQYETFIIDLYFQKDLKYMYKESRKISAIDNTFHLEPTTLQLK